MTEARTRALGARSDNGEEVALDLDTLIGSHLCVQANSGAGKSGTIRKILEGTHGLVQHIVLDVEDEFYTLRERFDYLIAGGENGDCAATVNNAGKLAITILETGFSAIVQINSLKLGDRQAFIRHFLEALTAAPRHLWRPLLLVLDEAQFYAPQVGSVPSSDAVVSFMMLGRKRGFTGILATPRAADLSKQATGPVNNWLIGRCGQPADRRSAADALGFPANSAEARGLRSLKAREFWAFGPALTIEPTLMRVGEASTTIIKAGQAAVPTPPAPAAMKAILASLNAAAAELVEPGVPASGEPGKGTVLDVEAIEAAELRGYERATREVGQSARQALMAFEGALISVRDQVDSVITMCRTQIAAASMRGAVEHPPASSPAEQRQPALAEARPPAKPAPAPPAGPASPVAQKVLDALAELAALGVRDPSRELVALMAGYTNIQTNSFKAAISGLKEDGLIVLPKPGALGLTANGQQKASAARAPRNAGEMRDRIIAILGSPADKMLSFLMQHYPRDVSREELGAAAGYTNVQTNSFKEAISKLKQMDFIVYPGPGRVRADARLYP